MNNRRARLIAFYLPQFHPILENDEWWGKGFTEWTNVTKAKPLFRGHEQPNLPGELGFYDLRVPEIRSAQAEMAREYGIEAFCYYHYWFGNGIQLLERPFNEVLASREPNFPFCLCWANATWTGIWYGAHDRILVEQTYPGMKDYESHFFTLLDAFSDDRYFTIDGKPVFVIFDPYNLPDPKRFTDFWRKLAIKSGLKGLYIIGYAQQSWDPRSNGFDASVIDCFGWARYKLDQYRKGYIEKMLNIDLKQKYREVFSKPTVYLYKDAINFLLPELSSTFEQYPCVIPNWDNTPRSGKNGVVIHKSSPELFRVHLKEAITQVDHKTPEKRAIFIKAWNEWAEGNHLEPNQKWGRAYLEATYEAINGLIP